MYLSCIPLSMEEHQQARDGTPAPKGNFAAPSRMCGCPPFLSRPSLLKAPTYHHQVPRNSMRDSMKSPQTHTPCCPSFPLSPSPCLSLEAKRESCEGSWIVYMLRCRKTCALLEDLFCQGSSRFYRLSFPGNRLLFHNRNPTIPP